MTKNKEIKKVIFGLQFLKEKLYNGIFSDRLDCIDYAISAIKELQMYKDNKFRLVPEDVYSRQCCELDAYKEIGTVEECRKAVEKTKPKKRIYPKTALERYYHEPECPNCKIELQPQICGYTLSQAIGIYSYCPWYGWSVGKRHLCPECRGKKKKC